MQNNFNFRVCLFGGYHKQDVDSALLSIHRMHTQEIKELHKKYEQLQAEYYKLLDSCKVTKVES